jgi:hypothetical protein
MPRYCFNLRDGAAGVMDPEGTVLADEAAAKAYATCIARELMARFEVQRRHWQLDVSDESGKVLFHVPFVDADDTIDHLSPKTRRLIERLCERQRELAETMFAARLIILRSRAVCARSQGKPYLAAQFGRRL